MHELAYATSLIRALESAAGERGIGRISRVEVVVGELAGVVPESLEFAFETLARGRGGILEGARLCIERRPALGRCRGCGAAFEAVACRFRCPFCGEAGPHIVQGDEFRLVAFHGVPAGPADPVG